jgi:multiple antibiotic resistance protein
MMEQPLLSMGMVFTAFMVMLGPVKIVGPFASMTSGLGEDELRKVAFRGFLFACTGGVVAAVVGQNTLVSWGISWPALHLAAAIVLLLVALKTVLAQYEPPVQAQKAAAPPPNMALSPLAFPTILTPHGIATFILILTVVRDPRRDAIVILLFFVVMAINLLVMRTARTIVRRGGTALAILGAVLGVLQVALAVQMMLDSLNELHVLPSP